MKSLKILSLVLAVACTSSLFSNESQYRPLAYVKACVKKCWLKRQPIDREVRGDLFSRHGHMVRGSNEGQQEIFAEWKKYNEETGRAEDFNLAEERTWVPIQAADPKSSDWYYGRENFNKFPTDLPLECFIDGNGKLKKNGAKIVLFHRNGLTGENTKVELNIDQTTGRCGCYSEFDQSIRARTGYQDLVKPYLKKPYTNPLSMFHSFVG